MKHTGMNMGRVKVQNRSLILHYICEVGPVSRKDIADATGLTAASVTQITTQLLKEGVLQEMGVDASGIGAGRKKVLLDFNAVYAYVYVLNMEVSTTTVALTDLRGNVLAKEVFPTNMEMEPQEFLKEVATVMKAMGAGVKAAIRKKIIAVTVGIPGLVNREQGVASHAYGIWEEAVPVAEILGGFMDLPVYVENNVDAFAMAELLYGIGRVRDNFLLIKWGPGVGSAIVMDKHVYEGRHGKTAELGHFIVKKDGKPCSCGRSGCLETVVSYGALQEACAFQPEEFGDVYAHASKDVQEAWGTAMDMFARTIINAATILAPERIVLAGKLFQGEAIRERVIAACMSYDPNLLEGRILYTELADKEDVLGPVAAYVQREIFE